MHVLVRISGNVALAALLLATPVRAETLKVPKQFATIQEAVDQAQPGDTVLIAAGRYVENVFVPVGKTGLTLRGTGRVQVDGHLGAGGGDVVLVEATDVTLSRLVLRHGTASGLRATNASGLLVERCEFLDNEARAVEASGDGITIRASRALGNDGGFAIAGAGARLEGCLVQQDGDKGIAVAGADALVTRCRVSNVTDGEGIAVSGERAVISRNVVELIDQRGIVVGGNDARIEKNRVAHTAERGIELFGSGIVVVGNRVEGIAEDGIFVSGDAFLVEKNVVARTFAEGTGIDISGSGGEVSSNKVYDAQEYGLSIVGDANTIARNLAQRCGSEEESGLFVEGDENLLSRNTVRESGDTGIELAGNANRAEGNRSLGALDDGIHVVSGTGNVLDGNRVLGNLGEGIQNGGSVTVLLRNRVKGNGLDVANQVGASITDGGGNAFVTGGFDVPPEID